MKKGTSVHKRKRKGLFFRIFAPLMRLRYPKPEFIYLGNEPICDGAVILSNHAGTDAPLSLEFYLGKPVSFWGAHEMTSGLIQMYRYQSRVYFHEKKHMNLLVARLFSLIASPLTNLFYSNLDMIPTYHDSRFVKTLRESVSALEAGDRIVIFPENSEKGYLDELEGFHAGFASLGQICLRRGMDIPVYVAYFRKSDMKYIIDKPVMFSELARDGASKQEIAQRLCDACNALGRMDLSERENSGAAGAVTA